MPVHQILLWGNPDHNRMMERLSKVLSQYGSVSSSTLSAGTGFRLLRKSACLPKGGGILVLFKEFDSMPSADFCRGWIAVTSSRWKNALLALQGSGIPAVLCGTSSRDSISISSWDFPKGSASILRRLSALSGETLEPAEIPMELRQVKDPEEAAVFCGILALCGVPWEKGYRL